MLKLEVEDLVFPFLKKLAMQHILDKLEIFAVHKWHEILKKFFLVIRCVLKPITCMIMLSYLFSSEVVCILCGALPFSFL